MTALEVILSVLLFILKAAGIIILAVLILILLTLLSVLFVPVRYKAEGRISVNCNDEGQSPVSGEFKASVSWLFHIISVKTWSRENKLYYYGKIFGKRIIDSEAPRSKKENKKKNNKDRSYKKEEASINEENTTENDEKENLIALDKSFEDSEQSNKQDTDKSLMDNAQSKEQDTDKSLEDNGADNEQNRDEAGHNNSLADKLRNIYYAIYTKFEKIKFKFIEICGKIKNVNGAREEFIEFLTTEESRSAISEIKCRIIKILLHIKPVRLTINAAFGLKEPASTGQVYGVLCILLSRYGDKININPQFNDVNKPFVSGDFKCNGRIRAAVLLIHAVKIYKIKRLKEFIAFAKGKGKKNGR